MKLPVVFSIAIRQNILFIQEFLESEHPTHLFQLIIRPMTMKGVYHNSGIKMQKRGTDNFMGGLLSKQI